MLAGNADAVSGADSCIRIMSLCCFNFTRVEHLSFLSLLSDPRKGRS